MWCESWSCSGVLRPEEYDRFHYIFERKYHYEKKIAEISKKIPLTEDEKYCFCKKLMAIDRDVMEVLNKRFCRKKLISIYYLIRNFLQEMSYENYKLVNLKISKQTLENYEKWWHSFKSLNNSSVKSPVDNPS